MTRLTNRPEFPSPFNFDFKGMGRNNLAVTESQDDGSRKEILAMHGQTHLHVLERAIRSFSANRRTDAADAAYRIFTSQWAELRASEPCPTIAAVLALPDDQPA